MKSRYLKEFKCLANFYNNRDPRDHELLELYSL